MLAKVSSALNSFLFMCQWILKAFNSLLLQLANLFIRETLKCLTKKTKMLYQSIDKIILFDNTKSRL